MSDLSARPMALGLEVLVKCSPAEVFMHVPRGAVIIESTLWERCRYTQEGVWMVPLKI